MCFCLLTLLYCFAWLSICIHMYYYHLLSFGPAWAKRKRPGVWFEDPSLCYLESANCLLLSVFDALGLLHLGRGFAKKLRTHFGSLSQLARVSETFWWRWCATSEQTSIQATLEKHIKSQIWVLCSNPRVLFICDTLEAPFGVSWSPLRSNTLTKWTFWMPCWPKRRNRLRTLWWRCTLPLETRSFSKAESSFAKDGLQTCAASKSRNLKDLKTFPVGRYKVLMFGDVVTAMNLTTSKNQDFEGMVWNLWGHWFLVRLNFKRSNEVDVRWAWEYVLHHVWRWCNHRQGWRSCSLTELRRKMSWHLKNSQLGSRFPD